LYLAPSTIPRAGLGIFTTIPRTQGDILGHGDVFLPLLEMDWHNEVHRDSNTPQQQQHEHDNHAGIFYFNPFSDYVWTGESMGMDLEVASDDVEVMGPGLDAAINCNLALLNVDKALPVWDDGGLHRSRDPGAGAVTLYHNGTTPVLYRDIPAGGELFKHYGDHWFTSRPEWFSSIPLTEHYPRAQELLQAFGSLIGIYHQGNQPSHTHSKTTTTSTTSPPPPPPPPFYMVTPTYPNFTISVDIQRDLWKLIANWPYPSRTLNALPKKVEDAWIAIQDDLTALYQPYAMRSEAYLEQYGKCFDHIKPERSTIAQAGRGAFAVRPLPQGTIITGTPLLHLPHKKVFDMYEFHHNETTGEWETKTTTRPPHTKHHNTTKQPPVVVGQQLKLNYCFGHGQSTLLLCPYGAGVDYINHNQTLANVRVQWSQHGLTSHNDSWFNLTPPQMEWVYKPNLALDYVALRDIEQGEELFLDYGDEFEAAWQQHVANWKPVTNAATYASAHDFNLRMADTPLRTEQEQDVDPYPDHLQIRCHSILSDPHWKHGLATTAAASNDFWSLDDKGHPCRIVQRWYDDNGDDYYNVHVYDHSSSDTMLEYTRQRVPRHAITFCDKPYTTDMHLPNAFRFPIMIPDEIFPNAWRNAIQNDTKQTL
jgi:hypothetical protein